MKKLGEVLGVLVLLLLFFYLTIFATLEYRSENISSQPADRWPLVGQVLASLSGLINQVNNQPLPLFAWGIRGVSFRVGEFIQNQPSENSDVVFLPVSKNQSSKISWAEYLKEAFKGGAFDLGVVWEKFTSYLKEFR